jgi:hypothetical protein
MFLGLTGCAAPARSTRLETLDFESIVVEIAASLRASDFLSDRTPSSPEVLLTVQKPTNLTSDLLTEGEKWYLIDRVTHSFHIRDLARERRIRFIIPAERLENLKELIPDDREIGSERAPTHVMTAVLRNVTRAAGADRTDLYAAHYTITSIKTGETEWTGEYLLKRAAQGRSYN